MSLARLRTRDNDNILPMRLRKIHQARLLPLPICILLRDPTTSQLPYPIR